MLSGRLIDVLSGVLFLATAINRVTSRDDGFQIYIYYILMFVCCFAFLFNNNNNVHYS